MINKDVSFALWTFALHHSIKHFFAFTTHFLQNHGVHEPFLSISFITSTILNYMYYGY